MPAPGRIDVETRRTLTIVHLALVGGVVLFAVTVLFLIRAGRGTGAPEDLLRLVWLAVAVPALFATGYARGRLRHDATGPEVLRAAVVVWALAEAPAILGITLTLVSGDSLPALAGLAVGLFLFFRHRPATF